MTAWAQGDKAAAVSGFVETDWKSGPLFPASSALSLTEAEFKTLAAAERLSKSKEMLPQIGALKQLAAAVAQAGRDAAANGDAARARQCFSSLQECGVALDTPSALALVQLVGRGIKKMAETELSRLGP